MTYLTRLTMSQVYTYTVYIGNSMGEWYHLEQGDIEALLNSLPEENDYSPFQSKIQALVYMLLQSPRPMVSTEIMQSV